LKIHKQPDTRQEQWLTTLRV